MTDWDKIDWNRVTVCKPAVVVPVTFEILMDAGLMTEEEARAKGWTPSPPIDIAPLSWRIRLRLRFNEYVSRVKVALLVLAGKDIHEDCERS